METREQFEKVMSRCRALFAKKLHDYGAAWRVMRPSSLTDQIYIKARRIRSIGTQGVALVDEGAADEFTGIVNYALIALIQCQMGWDDTARPVMEAEEALRAYDRHAREALELMLRKNHDYNEAWRQMRVSSYTDLILMKVMRTKQIEELGGDTLVSEGVEANYMDMMNYAVFALIKLTPGVE